MLAQLLTRYMSKKTTQRKCLVKYQWEQSVSIL